VGWGSPSFSTPVFAVGSILAIAVDSKGNIWLADVALNAIRIVNGIFIIRLILLEILEL
jgi:hypothetical protein